MSSKLKPKALTYSGAVKRTDRLLAEVQLSPLAKVPNFPPRTPYSPRGKRKHTGLSPEMANTPTKRTILQASPTSPSSLFSSQPLDAPTYRDLGDGVLKMTPSPPLLHHENLDPLRMIQRHLVPLLTAITIETWMMTSV